MFHERSTVSVLALGLALMIAGPLSGKDVSDPPAREGKGWRCGYVDRVRGELQGETDPRSDPRGPGDPQSPTPLTDVLHTKIDIAVDPVAKTVAGTVTITAQSTVDGLTQFVVYLDKSGNRNSVTSVGGAGVSFSHVNQDVTISLNQTYNAGQQFTVSINYTGAPISGIYWGGHNNGSQWVDIVATLSEPFYARGWWVGKDVLNDKSTFEIFLTVPNNLYAVSNGILQGIDTMPGNKLRYRWEEINPMIPYLASIAVADYAIYPRTYSHLGDTMPMYFYILPENNTPQYQSYANTYVVMTEVFSDVYGQYPFITEKGGMAQTPMLGAYMEHQTVPSMPNFTVESINAHELAHQWWGDDVTCETWGDIWLNEGFATFSEAIWDEFKSGGSGSLYIQAMNGSRPSNPDARVYVTDVNNAGAIFSGNSVYNKGSWVAHMLRGVLGDDVFFQALLDYRATHGGSSATTQEFIDSVSATAGYDLSFFTDQWVFGVGSPDYRYSWSYGLPDCSTGGVPYLFLNIEQTQSTRGYGLFTMPIHIRVQTASGNEDYVVWSIDASETYAIPVGDEPTGILFDPWSWVLTHSVTPTSPGPTTAPCQGDMNQDGDIDGRDVPGFVDAIIGPSAGPAEFRRADMNFDRWANLSDLPLFLDLLLDRIGPPQPNPMTWQVAPAPLSTSEITMTAAEATDPSGGIEYKFTALGSGSQSSNWQASRVYTDSGLFPNFPYSYKVRARDGSSQQLETQDSVVYYVATAIETPAGISVGDVTANSIGLTADGSFSNLTNGSSGLYFEMVPSVPGSGANQWVQSQTRTITGLSPNTQYTFRVKGRNFFGANETVFTDPVAVMTAGN